MQLTTIIIHKLAAMSFRHVHLNIGNSRGGAKREASPIFLLCDARIDRIKNCFQVIQCLVFISTFWSTNVNLIQFETTIHQSLTLAHRASTSVKTQFLWLVGYWKVESKRSSQTLHGIENASLKICTLAFETDTFFILIHIDFPALEHTFCGGIVWKTWGWVCIFD